MPSYNASGIVVHRTDLGEHDRILTLFTRDKGKLSAVAKGSRRAASRLSGATELFVHARMQLAVGKTLDIVTQCEIQQSFSGLR
ncbi:MAG TPA: DNA repair protein RecO, partial [Chthonomonadaceae bacterium]|nr:DNA repair protein RecO [Chthonomonadaceae bacterium]